MRHTGYRVDDGPVLGDKGTKPVLDVPEQSYHLPECIIIMLMVSEEIPLLGQ